MAGYFPFLLFALSISSALCQLDISVLEDTRTPVHSSSPGWAEQPKDATVGIGDFATFRCFTRLYSSQVTWVINNRTVDSSSAKFKLHDSDRIAVYGPVEESDDGALISCRVHSYYSLLPSQVARITIKALPIYRPKKIQVAQLGESFEFDFGYSSPKPPQSYSWTKNGLPFVGIRSRILLSHEGILFATVLQEDVGDYVVTATNSAGSTSASAVLEVDLFEDGETNRTLSLKLAIFLALKQNNYDYSAFHTVTDANSHASRYSQQVIELFHKFKKPSPASRVGGISRLQIERLLLHISLLVESDDLKLSDEDMNLLESHTACSASHSWPICTILDLHYRRADGTCNNFFYPLNGATGSPLARILPAMYEDGISAPVGETQLLNDESFRPPWPSARYVSSRVIKTIPEAKTGGITHMVMQWGQFVDHDLDLSPVFDENKCGCAPSLTCIPIRVHPGDYFFGVNSSNNGDCLTFSRSVPSCYSGSSKRTPRNQVNDLTSYIDASNMYGSTKKMADALRLFKGGLLKQGGRLESLKGNLPVENKTADNGVPLFVAGDERVTEHVGLTVMHTIWMREHNRIARELVRINPCWNDERIYQETRKIVGALQQAISFKEFLPALYGPHLNTYLSHYRGYNPFVDATIPNSFSAAAFRVGHTLVRTHFQRLDRNYRRLDIGPLPLRQAFNNPLAYYQSFGTDPILRGLTVDKANHVDEFLNIVLTSELFAKEGDDLGMDLASLNIQRGRDHGLPSYRQWERFCKRLYPNIKASFSHKGTEEALRNVYGDEGFAEGIDLWVGSLAEKTLPGAHLGPTFACILGITFSRLRDGDRFWYQNPYVFTSWQRREIERATLAKVVCTNGDDIPTIQRSVFEEGPRVSCSSIQGLNLWMWRDRRCRTGHQFYGK